MMGREHADVWGLASYGDGDPDVEHRDTAAFEGIHFSAAVERIYAKTVIAHVRQATVGVASALNTHPFRYGRWTFAHNGTLANFTALQQQLREEAGSRLNAERRGSTDSELIFLWLLSRLDKSGVSLSSPCGEGRRIAEVLVRSIKQLDKAAKGPSCDVSQLNFLLTDGRVLLAARWNHPLHYVQRFGVHDCEICGIPHIEHRPDANYRACVIASEPISHESWQPLANQTVLLAESEADLQVFEAA